MSEKVFMFPEGNTSGNSNVDPALLMALNNGGGFGGNGNWMWIIFLFFLYPLMRNGGFGGFGCGNDLGNTDFLASLANNNTGRELLMSAIQGNGNAINSLASQLNCDINAVKTALNSEMAAIQNVGNQVGMSGMQVVNAVQAGDTALGQLIASCCCENRLAICNQTNTLQQAINTNGVNLEKGFSSLAYATQSLTCDIQGAINDGIRNIKDSTIVQTNAIINKLDQMQTSALQDKISSLLEQKSSLLNQISLEQQNQTIAAMINPLQQELAAIKAALPNTVPVQWPLLAVAPAYAATGYCGAYACGGNFWN